MLVPAFKAGHAAIGRWCTKTALGMRSEEAIEALHSLLFQPGYTARRETSGNRSRVDAQRIWTVRDSQAYVKAHRNESNAL